MAHRECLKASLDGIEAARTEPNQIFCARYNESGGQKACYTLFAIIPHDKEEILHQAVKSILWPEE
jgi:hypothetical protein